MKSYKNLFWISILILIFSNIFWTYTTIDNAVGQNYYKVSCDEYSKDAISLRKILKLKSDKFAVVKFLENNKIEYESFEKGSDFVIMLNSFDL